MRKLFETFAIRCARFFHRPYLPGNGLHRRRGGGDQSRTTCRSLGALIPHDGMTPLSALPSFRRPVIRNRRAIILGVGLQDLHRRTTNIQCILLRISIKQRGTKHGGQPWGKFRRKCRTTGGNACRQGAPALTSDIQPAVSNGIQTNTSAQKPDAGRPATSRDDQAVRAGTTENTRSRHAEDMHILIDEYRGGYRSG